MTQTGYSNAIVNVMLGWLKGLATWVLKLFNLAGSGGNPLLWLSENWLTLLIVLLVVGVVVDWLVWMIRWRPYWVWMRKKRIIVNDERFLAGEEFEELDTGEVEDDFEREYVVPSTVVKRSAGRPAATTPRRRPAASGTQSRAGSTVVARRQPEKKAAKKSPPPRSAKRTELSDDLFEVGGDQEDFSDFYEDEVFNVSSLPEAPEPDKRRRKRR